jgi:hypothetical protein
MLTGALGVVAQRVQIGMSQHEVVSLILGSGGENLDALFVNGVTQDGRPISGMAMSSLRSLPPASQVLWLDVEMGDDDGRELVIALGAGGVVTGTRLRSPWVWEGWQYALSAGGTP